MDPQAPMQPQPTPTPTPPQPQAPAPQAPAPTPAPAPVPAAPAAPQAAAESERNLLAALGLTSAFGIFGLHSFYLGNKTLGIIRLVLAVIALPLPFLYFGLGLWMLIDFFRIGSKRLDAQGQTLKATAVDEKYAKILKILMIISIVLAVLGFVFSVLVGAMGAIQEAANAA